MNLNSCQRFKVNSTDPLPRVCGLVARSELATLLISALVVNEHPEK